MTEHEFERENGGRCPGCPRHCELSAPGCLRGEAYAAGEPHYDGNIPNEPEYNPHHGPYNEWKIGSKPHHSPGTHQGPGCGPHHGPNEGPEPHPGPEHGPGPGRGPHPGPGPHRGAGPGPHRGPHRGPRPEPPEPEPDRDSLLGLMRRCGHYLAHRAGAVSSRERMLRLLAERGEMQQSDLVYLLELRSASVSEQLGKLEAQGLVERRRSEEDRRGVTIELTQAGRELAESAGAQADMFSALSGEEQEQLRELLQRLLSSWESGTGRG